MQNAQQKAQQAAQMMQQQVQQQAQQSNMSPEQFQGMESPMPPMPGQQPAGKPGKNLSNAPTPKNRKFSRNAFSDDPDAELDWFKMKSDSTTGADADPLADVPAEYRGLVREYFKALNDGGKK
jgi:type II secretory pathway pseudopilin PulG